jgi:hypothetical protein
MRTGTVILFICGLGIIAIIENSTFDQMSQRHALNVAAVKAQQQQQETQKLQEQQREQEQRAAKVAAEQAAELAAQQAAAEHARYLARYTDNSFTRKPGTKTIAVAVATENATWNSDMSGALVSRFKNDPVQLLSSFFKPAFVSDGLFNNAFDNSIALFNKLELSKSLDGLLLARERVRYTTNPSLENVITASMELDVTTLPIGSQAEKRTWTFTAAGAGFTQENARQQAEERLIKQIANDTKMTLN